MPSRLPSPSKTRPIHAAPIRASRPTAPMRRGFPQKPRHRRARNRGCLDGDRAAHDAGHSRAYAADGGAGDGRRRDGRARHRLSRLHRAAPGPGLRASPRGGHFKENIIEAFARGTVKKPLPTFGNVKADVLAQGPGYTNAGFYSADTGYFNNARTTGPLTAAEPGPAVGMAYTFTAPMMPSRTTVSRAPTTVSTPSSPLPRAEQPTVHPWRMPIRISSRRRTRR
jgi:hypothetical protein